MAVGLLVFFSWYSLPEAAPPASQAFDWQAALARLEVTDGPLRGSVRAAPGGAIVWYFSNLGLYPLVSRAPHKVRAYLEAYVAHSDGPTALIRDVESDGSQIPPDSHDAYAGTFLRLAVHYVQSTGDLEWWRLRREKVLRIAWMNIATQVKTSPVPGLTRVFQAASRGASTAYLMDNCEVYAGVTDLARLLQATGQAKDALYWGAVGRNVARGVSLLYVEGTGAYRVADEEDAPRCVWEPDAFAQVFPQMCGVPPLDGQRPTLRKFDRAYAFARQCAPHTQDGYSGYPGLVWAGYLAAKRGNRAQAGRFLSVALEHFRSPQAYSSIRIEELGALLSLQDTLRGPAPTPERPSDPR